MADNINWIATAAIGWAAEATKAGADKQKKKRTCFAADSAGAEGVQNDRRYLSQGTDRLDL